MKRYVFHYTAEKILSEVKNITTMLGASRRNEDGSTQLVSLSLTEDDDLLFQRFLKDAHAYMQNKLVAYIIEPEDDEREMSQIDICDLDPDNRLSDDDLRLYRLCYPCQMNEDIPDTSICVADNYILQFLINYIIYRWLMIKNPQEAMVYKTLSDDNADNVVSSLSQRKSGKIRRRIHPW